MPIPHSLFNNVRKLKALQEIALSERRLSVAEIFPPFRVLLFTSAIPTYITKAVFVFSITKDRNALRSPAIIFQYRDVGASPTIPKWFPSTPIGWERLQQNALDIRNLRQKKTTLMKLELQIVGWKEMGMELWRHEYCMRERSVSIIRARMK